MFRMQADIQESVVRLLAVLDGGRRSRVQES